ncbi:hypothetical protein ACC685_33495 [Rhizobium ruizarguesonis]
MTAMVAAMPWQALLTLPERRKGYSESEVAGIVEQANKVILEQNDTIRRLQADARELVATAESELEAKAEYIIELEMQVRQQADDMATLQAEVLALRTGGGRREVETASNGPRPAF